MPAVNSIQAGSATAAIARASSRTGVDFDYLIAQARIESGLNPQARATTSSARGLYQFVDQTWLRTIDRHGGKHGLAWAQDAVHGGRVTDAALRGEIMALRDDPDASALMAAELALDNREGLRARLGREPDHAELYLAHFLGLGGAQEFLAALAGDPGQLAQGVNPAAARANRAIFFESSRPRSVGEVMEVIRGKMSAAAGAAPAGGPSPFAPAAFAARLGSSQALPDGGAAEPMSMADMLRSTFGDGSGLGGRAGARVAAAYSAFRAFAL